MLRKVRTTLLRRGVSADDADDLVHQAFLRVEVYEHSHAIRSKEALLMTTAVNLAKDQERQRRRAPFTRGVNGLDDVIDAMPGAEEILLARARLRHLNKGLEQLPENSRRILLARRLDNVSIADIALKEGMTVAAIEKQIARATLKLMRWMDEW